jgi:ABC-type lipoprotein release transport system permease subunit
MLIQTSPSDPLTLVTISIVLTVIVLGAALRPAYRAARLDPAAALHYE